MRTVQRVPVITAVAVCVAVAAAIVQYAAPAVVPVLRRDQDMLATGEWWRLVTPLFVQTLGWHQVVTNLVTLVLVGVVAERLLTGRAQASRWEVGVVVCYTAALTEWGFGGLRVAAMVLVVAALLSYAAPRSALLAAVACAVALSAAADLHGVSLLSGMVTALVLVGLSASRAGAAVRPELAIRRA